MQLYIYIYIYIYTHTHTFSDNVLLLPPSPGNEHAGLVKVQWIVQRWISRPPHQGHFHRFVLLLQLVEKIFLLHLNFKLNLNLNFNFDFNFKLTVWVWWLLGVMFSISFGESFAEIQDMRQNGKGCGIFGLFAKQLHDLVKTLLYLSQYEFSVCVCNWVLCTTRGI